MSKMKNSGIEWIGEIPEDWEIIQLSSLFSQHKEKNTGLKNDNLLSLSYGKIKQKDITATDGLLPENFEGYNIISSGDIVLRLTDLQNDHKSLRVGHSEQEGIITSAYITIRKRNNNLNTKYFYYLMHTFDVMKGFYGMGAGVRQGLSFDELKKLLLCYPSQSEQNAIVSAIESKTTKIDSLISNEEKQIEKLKAYKQALITETVTKGLDKTVKMKNSGIIWLGEIPETWEVLRGKVIFSLLKRNVLDSDEVITCFRDGTVTLRKNRREEGFTFSDKEIGYQGVEPGDLCVHGMDGFAGAIGVSDSRGKVSPIINVLETDYNKRFYMYFLRSMAYRNIFTALSTGIRVRSCDLRWNKLANLQYAVPPKTEQNLIADFLDKKCTQIAQLITIKEQKIEKLNAYKKSLIYEYVTGKKQVSSCEFSKENSGKKEV